MFREILHALADGFGYVIASLVGALVALSFSTPEEIPNWYYIGTISFALVGAVVIALLRRGIDGTFIDRNEEDAAHTRGGDKAVERLAEVHREVGGVEDAVDLARLEVMAELRALRSELEELRKPWWERARLSLRRA